MKFHACAAALALAPLAQAQDIIRYDFNIRVLTNTVPSGGGLSSIGVGEEGTFSITALDDRTIFPTIPSTPTFQSHRILDLSIQIGSYSSAGDAAVYPSTIDLFGLLLDDNTPLSVNSNIYDSFVALPQFADPEIGTATLGLQQSTIGFNPSFITSLDLPRSLDLSLPTNAPTSDLRLPSGPFGGTVAIDIYDVTITVIPTPASIPLLALAALTTTRRRR